MSGGGANQPPAVLGPKVGFLVSHPENGLSAGGQRLPFSFAPHGSHSSGPVHSQKADIANAQTAVSFAARQMLGHRPATGLAQHNCKPHCLPVN